MRYEAHVMSKINVLFFLRSKHFEAALCTAAVRYACTQSGRVKRSTWIYEGMIDGRIYQQPSKLLSRNSLQPSAQNLCIVVVLWPLSESSLWPALSTVRASVRGSMLEECLSYRVTQCPTAFAPGLAHSEAVILVGAVSRVTKSTFLHSRGAHTASPWFSSSRFLVGFQTSLCESSKHARQWCSLPEPGRGTWSLRRCFQKIAGQDTSVSESYFTETMVNMRN